MFIDPAYFLDIFVLTEQQKAIGEAPDWEALAPSIGQLSHLYSRDLCVEPWACWLWF